MNLLNIIKLAKVLTKLAVIDSDQGPITVEDIIEGAEVFIEDADGNIIPAADGIYIIEDGKRKITVAEGKITRIEEIELEDIVDPSTNMPKEEENAKKRKCEDEAPANEPAETPANEPTAEDKIKELEAIIEERDAKIKELEAEIENLKSAPVETEMKKVENKMPFKTYKNTKY